ncbi:hypothetical protein [Micromonospora cremea]|uniref:EthD domain-containing protein n=1 Tax=Micromonospora cremea TaxID=709881 RepID=A0A1N5UG48_9ACTN|nr:hypothetical protein [Micromonospora cremea]SIM59185.1 hypothetical protein SAMN04489832_0853 [Micromonospora cremea]
MSAAVLLAVLRPKADDVDDFFTWYEAEHVTGRLAMPGFLDAHRYVSEDDHDMGLVIYDLASLDVLSTEAYRALQARTAATTQTRMGGLDQFVRVTGEVIQEHGDVAAAVPLLFVVAFSAPRSDLDDLDAWYREEHAPMLLKAAAWRGVSLVDVTGSNTPWTRVAIHRLADASALESPERRAAGEAPRRQQLAARPWFNAGTRYRVRAVDRLDSASRRR